MDNIGKALLDLVRALYVPFWLITAPLILGLLSGYRLRRTAGNPSSDGEYRVVRPWALTAPGIVVSCSLIVVQSAFFYFCVPDAFGIGRHGSALLAGLYTCILPVAMVVLSAKHKDDYIILRDRAIEYKCGPKVLVAQLDKTRVVVTAKDVILTLETDEMVAIPISSMRWFAGGNVLLRELCELASKTTQHVSQDKS